MPRLLPVKTPDRQSLPLIKIVILLTLIALILTPALTQAQTSPEEHKSHHPGASDTAPATTDDTGMGMEKKDKKPGGMGMGGKSGGMGGGGMKAMMKAMARPKSSELFPTLIKFPELSTEQRTTLLERARQMESAGVAQLHKGFADFTQAQGRDDLAAMRTEAAAIEAGLSRFRSGLAVRQALNAGIAPQRTALQWYKSQLNLLPPAAMRSGFQLFGMTPFSLFICLFSLLIGLTLVTIYLLKVRRTSQLLARLTADPPVGPTLAAAEDAPAARTAPPAADTEPGCCSSAAEKTGQSEGLLEVGTRKLCRLRVVRIYQETPEVKTFRMVACDGTSIPFSYQPGQFLTISIPHAGKTIKRNYSISSSPTQGYYCEITVKREEQGVGSRYLHDVVKQGDTLEVQPPSGRFIFTGKEAESIVLIGGGVGVTPMMSVARAMLDIGWSGELYFIYACRTREEFIFADEMNILKRRNPNLKSFILISDLTEETDGFHAGMLTGERLAAWVPEITAKRIHLCGSPPMMEALKAMLAQLGVPKEQIKFELFGPPATPKKAAPAKSVSTTTTGATISFQRSGKSGQLQTDETVLEAAERLGVEIDSSCRAGSCGMCAVKLLSGEVEMASEEGLHPDDKAQGMILACQAVARTDLIIEA